jgi:2-polyprenyl-6-methoxyphenol hydroxylase-like FAD-dependent oxidoreductase
VLEESSQPEPVVIIGAGVAGLATAVGLRNAGVEVRVFEKGEQLEQDFSRGAGFLLMSNGLHALDRLGLGARARALGVTAHRVVVRGSAGEIIREKEVPEHIGLTRRALQDLLLDALPAGIATRGMRFVDFEHDSSGLAVRAVFDDGQAVRGSWFVGADGVGSQVRRVLFPGSAASPVRVRELLSMVHAPELAPELRGSLVKVMDRQGGLSVGIVPVAGDELIWYLTHDPARHDLSDLGPEELRESAQRLLHGWADPIPWLVSATDFSRSYLWNTTDAALPSHIGTRNVLLLGDAATTLLPFSTQGVNSALEGAAGLAEHVPATAAGPALLAALADFHDSRGARLDRFLHYGRKRADNFLDPLRFGEDVPFPEEFETLVAREPAGRST